MSRYLQQPSRRRLLKSVAATAAATLVWPARAAPAPGRRDPRLVLVILRGGVDGLALAPPWADPQYRNARGSLALAPPGADGGVLALDARFGLHPALTGLYGLYKQGELMLVHAVAPPYRARSHFDAQRVLESGLADPRGLSDGWLYRALAALPGAPPPDRHALALGESVPLVLRGKRSVASWSPDRLPDPDPDPDDDTMARIASLYAADKRLAPRFGTMLATAAMAGTSGTGRRRQQMTEMAATAARMLAHASGPRLAVLESSGWDTHARQGAASGPLANRLARLDEVIMTLRAQLGAAWRDTIVLVVTEFGRTVAPNGTGGSDHGVGSAALIAGGAARGGRVLANWPGLARGQLFEGRDLDATLDLRCLFAGVLIDHLGADANGIDGYVFPRGEVNPVPGLV